MIDDKEAGFTALATKYLDRLEEALKQAQSGTIKKQLSIPAITEPVMRLKAHAATYRYSAIRQLTNVMLSFMDAIADLDEEALEIAEAHHTSLRAIVAKTTIAEAEHESKKLEKELKNACARYFNKRKAGN